jgi:sugar phosphate isomerase/epimerase
MGRGIVDWVGQFKALKRDGYRSAVSLETHWDGGGTAEQSSSDELGRDEEDLARS